MNKYIVTLIMSFFALSIATAQQIDHTFTYQGELSDGGMPANGLYNFQIEGFDAAGNSKTDVSEHLLVPVDNGLFTINDVDLGVAGLDAYATFLQIRVKGLGVGSFIDLTPRQKLKAVPYAHKVIDGAATNGQVYTFSTTGGWGPADPVNLSPWTKDGQDIYFLSNTAVGTLVNSATHKLTVKASLANNNHVLRLIGTNGGSIGHGARMNFGDNEFVYLEEDVDDHLIIRANQGIEFLNNTKQPLETGGGTPVNGQMKFMIHANCSLASPSIIKQYNGVDSGVASIASSGVNGLCKITFPFDISNRFYQVSVVNNLSGRSANCQISASGLDLNCARFNTGTFAGDNGQIMVLVY